jgi:ribosome-associated heat shock protein Hsp15
LQHWKAGPVETKTLRIDKFLWFARLTKTRSLATRLADAGHIRIDGRRIARAHAAVKPGDTITLMVYDRIRIIRIAALPVRRGPPAEASACYTDIAIDAPPQET